MTVYTATIAEHGVGGWDTVACSPMHAAEIAARVWGGGEIAVRDAGYPAGGEHLYQVHIVSRHTPLVTYLGRRLDTGEVIPPPLDTGDPGWRESA